MAVVPAARPHPRLAAASWLSAPATRQVLDAIEAAGFGARVVGGSVRNTLLGEPVSDIDIATEAPPQDVIALFAKAGLKTIPTGLAHGTVTVVSHGVPYEVTTLRRDVATDGRRATVSFTDDWAADAARRDFTINALYCDKAGVLFDPAGGLDDIEHRRIRFIGNAHERIREDYLRILRFFRFSAQYAGGRLDDAALAACLEERAGMKQLSAERIHNEMMKLLTAPDAAAVAAVMATYGLLEDLLGFAGDVRALERLSALAAHHTGEPGYAAAAEATLRLAALIPREQDEMKTLKERLRLSNDESERIAAAHKAANAIDAAIAGATTDLAEPEAQALIYAFGNARFIDGLMLSWARGQAPADGNCITRTLRLALTWQRPNLPVVGRDILACGVPPGPRVSHILDQFERWWIATDFTTDHARIEAELARLVVVTNA